MASSNIKSNIKSSALELFNTSGYEATSIRDLSSKAGCSLPMMYYYYESKEKLLEEIVTVDFVSIINEIFTKARKTNDLRLFAISFTNDILALSGDEKKACQIALRLHMGAPKNESLNKFLISYKFQKETALKEFLLTIWRIDKDIEVKTRFLLDVLYHTLICALLTGRQITVKQVESDIRFLM